MDVVYIAIPKPKEGHLTTLKVFRTEKLAEEYILSEGYTNKVIEEVYLYKGISMYQERYYNTDGDYMYIDKYIVKEND